MPTRKTFRKLQLKVRRTGIGFGPLDNNGEVPSPNLKRVRAELLIDPTFYTKPERWEHLEIVRHD